MLRQRITQIAAHAVLVVALVFGVQSVAFAATISSDLAQHIGTVAFIIQKLSIGMGICMMLGAFFKFKRYGEARTMMMHRSIAAPIMMMLAAVMMLSLPTFIKAFLFAFWGSSTPYAPNFSGFLGGLFDGPLAPMLMFVRVIGLCSFIRGIITIGKSGRENGQPGAFGKGLLYIFGGVLAVHVVGVFNLFEAFTGFSF